MLMGRPDVEASGDGVGAFCDLGAPPRNPFFIGADEPQDDWTSQNIHCDKGGAHSRTAASGLCVRLSFSRYLWRHRE